MANITYRQVGDYMIPNLTLPPEESTIRLGKWGMLHKDYLEKYNPTLFFTLLTQGTLYQHCADIENQAQEMFDTLVEQMKESEGVTEQLKVASQMKWVQLINNIHERAAETVYSKVVFVGENENNILI